MSFPPNGPNTQQDARTMPNGAAPNGAAPPQPPMYPPPRGRSRIPALALGAYAAGLGGIVLAAVVLALFVMYKSQATAQLSQMRAALTTTQSRLAKFQADQGIKYTHLSGDLSNLGNDLAPYNMICSTDLSGTNGQPGQFWFPCSGQHP